MRNSKKSSIFAASEAQITLNALAKKINTDKVGKPSFRMVLTVIGKFEDGTLVVPIGCLKH